MPCLSRVAMPDHIARVVPALSLARPSLPGASMPHTPPRRERVYSSRYAPARERTRLQRALDKAEIAEIRAVAAELWPDRDAIAEELGVSLRHLYRELERLGVQAEDIAPASGGMTGLS